MLRSLKQLYGELLSATDGEIGTIKDFYFDGENWAIRYLAMNTGDWLANRKVLISPHSLASLPAARKGIQVSLTRKKIEKSPSIGPQNPVLREYEEQHHKHYGLPPYWKASAADMIGPQQQPETHLHSALSVTGYLVRVGDETIGHVSDFMVNTKNWKIGQLVVKTGHRLSGIDTLISPKRVERISYDQSTVFAYPILEISQQTPANNLVPTGTIL
jgi:hypothetical protein